MKKLALVLVLVVALFATSCKVRVSDNFNTNKFENKVSYFQDQKTGAVFAIVIVAKQMSAVQEGVGLAYIPKDEVTPAIVKEIKNYNPNL